MNDRIQKIGEILKKPKVLIAAGIAGMVLILVSSFLPSGEKKTKTASGEAITAQEYGAQLEKSLSQTVRCITGSKKVQVVVTLESGIRYTYADIHEGTTANKTESDYESTSDERKQSYITVRNADGGEQALLVTSEMPEVRGVAIICEGGDDPVLNEKIKNAVTAALNITSKRVYVAGGF